MSRFRFRVWDKGKKEYCDRNFFMTPNGELGFLIKDSSPHWRIFQNTDWCIIEQCTGLKDKNGKLIYEGDVVRVEDDYGVCNPRESIDTGVGNVEWVCGMWYIAGQVNLGLYETTISRYIEIIGNVHEMEKENE